VFAARQAYGDQSVPGEDRSGGNTMQGCTAIFFRPSSDPEWWPEALSFNRDRGGGNRETPRAILALIGRAGDKKEVLQMCDYSLQSVKSRPAKIGEKLTTQHFNTGTIGFAAPEDANTAVCILPGTELAFAKAVRCRPRGLLSWKARTLDHTTAIFRQVNKQNPRTHHDALEFPNGQKVLLTDLLVGQEATVLQLPAQPVTAAEIKAQERVRHVG
jgi:hypothetical protein